MLNSSSSKKRNRIPILVKRETEYHELITDNLLPAVEVATAEVRYGLIGKLTIKTCYNLPNSKRDQNAFASLFHANDHSMLAEKLNAKNPFEIAELAMLMIKIWPNLLKTLKSTLILPVVHTYEFINYNKISKVLDIFCFRNLDGGGE